MADGEDRTEAASAKRLEQAREEGNAAISRELPALASLLAAMALLAMLGPVLGRTIMGRLRPMLTLSGQDPMDALWGACIAIALMAAPFVLASLLAGGAATLVQTRFLVSFNRLMPDITRLSPMHGLKRIFGVRGLVEAGKSAVKLGVLGFAGYHSLSVAAPSLAAAVFWLPGQLTSHILQQVLRLMMLLLAMQTVIAGADFAWMRFRHARDLRMSREELKQESKETDGNPQVKGRLRQLRMARARRRMLAAVPTATVVVTNPTHYAIALTYDRDKGAAPRVVAKGVDDVAARIREVALDSRVPLVANPPLARALYRVDVDAEIPAEHFKVVAEIIAYVWRLRGKR
jgi:flagellar biosynthetic protein FlhB